MAKLIGFSLLWYLFGNPFIAILVLILIIYLLDRTFIGILPNVAKPLREWNRLRKLKQELAANPHHTSTKVELGRTLSGRKRYREALALFRQAEPVMNDSADLLVDIGYAMLKLGELEEGERTMLKALERNPRVGFGDPYLYLGQAFQRTDKPKAVAYLEKFKDMHSSSCRGYYQLGRLYAELNQPALAKQAFEEATGLYRSLPKYKRKQERRFALLAYMRSRSAGSGGE